MVAATSEMNERNLNTFQLYSVHLINFKSFPNASFYNQALTEVTLKRGAYTDAYLVDVMK